MKAYFRIASVDEAYMGGTSATLEIEVYPTLNRLKKIVGWSPLWGIDDSRAVVIYGELQKLTALDENFAWKAMIPNKVWPHHMAWCKKFQAEQIKLQQAIQKRRAKAEKKRSKRK